MLTKAEIVHRPCPEGGVYSDLLFTWSGRNYSTRRPYHIGPDGFEIEKAHFIKRREAEDAKPR